MTILTAEDVIVLKLEWYRLGDEVSQQQWRDVMGLLKVRRADIDYARRAAGELGIADLLERVLEQASLS